MEWQRTSSPRGAALRHAGSRRRRGGTERRSATAMQRNLTTPAHTSSAHHNFPALVFGVLLIIVIICGNLLVCLSVYAEKALKTTTNYFIVSLAVADLLLAVLVLPLFVYAEVRLESQDYLFVAYTQMCGQMCL